MNKVLSYLKTKKPDYSFDWHGQKMLAVYESVKSLSMATNIPLSTLYSILKKMKNIDGFHFNWGIISYEYLDKQDDE